MKKIVLFILLSSFSINAQNREKNDIELSGFIGLGMSNYYGDYVTSGNKLLSTLYFGLNSDFYINDRWSVKIGLEYQTFGSKITELGLVPNSSIPNDYQYMTKREEFNFLSVPIHPNVHFGKKRNWNINFGPTFNFLLDENVGIRSEQFGLGLGIGYKYEISNNFAIGVDHQEFIAITNNLSSSYYSSSFIGNYSGSFSIKLIVNIKQ